MKHVKQQDSDSRTSTRSQSRHKLKYMVTGGAGFIGSHLASHLAAQGNEVVVLDNFSTGKRSNVADLPVTLIEGDIRDMECVTEALQGVDTVFHQAALCSVARSVENPLRTHDVNVTGTLNLFEACRKAGVRRMVFASSSSVYGDAAALPKEESMPSAPLSPYAVSKLTGEYYGALYWQLYGLETVALRYFNVFGPRQDPESEYAAVIPKFLQGMLDHRAIQIYGDGSQTRDFTYVENVVAANIAASTSRTAAGKAINVACGGRWSLLQLVSRLDSILKSKSEIAFKERRAGDVKHSQASIVRAQELLGYNPAVDFDEGLKRTVEWYISNNESMSASPVTAAAGGH